MEYLTTLHNELYPSPKARELKARIIALYKSFHAQEKIRSNSYLHGRELARNQTGYSRKKKWLHEQQLAEGQGQRTPFDQLGVQYEDDDQYDTKADEESDRLEQSLER